jgi:hypothetical protein
MREQMRQVEEAAAVASAAAKPRLLQLLAAPGFTQEYTRAVRSFFTSLLFLSDRETLRNNIMAK